MSSFVTPEELIAHPLPVTDAQWAKISRDKLVEVLEVATQNIKDYLDRNLETISYVERITGNGRFKMMLDEYPIISLDGVTALDISETSSSYATTDFLIHNGAGIIEWVDKLRNNFFVNKTWEIEYTAGLASIPGPVKHATMLEAVALLNPMFRGGVNFSQASLIDDANETMVDLLEFYKRKRMG